MIVKKYYILKYQRGIGEPIRSAMLQAVDDAAAKELADKYVSAKGQLIGWTKPARIVSLDPYPA